MLVSMSAKGSEARLHLLVARTVGVLWEADKEFACRANFWVPASLMRRAGVLLPGPIPHPAKFSVRTVPLI